MRVRMIASAGIVAVVAVSGCSSTSSTSSPSTTGTTSSTTATAGGDVVGSWRASASDILGANTANVGGAGGLTCNGPITMTFEDNGSFHRHGRVTCSIQGTSKSGAISTTGNYTTSGDQITFSGVRASSASPVPDSFGDATAQYSVSGTTLTIVFTNASVGEVTQVYSRVSP